MKKEAPTPKRHQKGQKLTPAERLARTTRIQELSIELKRPMEIVRIVMAEWGVSYSVAQREYGIACEAWVADEMGREAVESRREVALARLAKLYTNTDDPHVRLGVLKEMNKVSGLYHPLSVVVKDQLADEAEKADRERLVELMQKHRGLLDSGKPERDPN